MNIRTDLCKWLCFVAFLSFGLAASLPAQEPGGGQSSPSTSATQDKNENKGVKDSFKYYFEIGGQFREISGDRPTKFEEYGQIRRGFLARRFRIASNPAGNPDFFRLVGRNAAEHDQQFILDFGRYELYRTTLEWKNDWLYFSKGGRSLFAVNGGSLDIPDAVQTTLQNTPDASLAATVFGLLSSSPELTIRSKRGTLKFTQKFQVTKELSFRVNWTRIEKSGSKPLGSGSYERVGTASGDTFRVHSIELVQSLDNTTDQFNVGASYRKRNWGFNFDYTYLDYKTRIEAITYDNPFRITDLQATGSGGVFDRMKMARGELAMEPGNHSHTLAFSAFVDIAKNTRLAGAWSWSKWKQDQEFRAYTLNTAIVTGVPAGLNITSTSSLPQSDLEGEVEIFTQDYLFSSRPWKNFGFNVHYRRYENDNKTEAILFPGYVAYLDSYWRTNIANVPIENEVQSFFKTNTTAEATWDISKRFRWNLGYEWEGWVREHRQAAKTNEHNVFTRFTYEPTGRFSSRFSYRFSERSPKTYDPGVKEFGQLRMFDQSKRLRHKADLQWQYSVRPEFGISGTFAYQSDDFDQNFFGLVRFEQWSGSFDLLYIPNDTTTFYANYSRENYKNKMQTVAKTAAPYALQNRWNRDEKDVLNNFGVGVTAYAMKEKLLMDLNYVFSDATTRISTFNPDVPLANSLTNATAYPFPDVKSRFQEFNADLSYQFGNNWGLGVRYIFQPYSLDDFAWNQLSPYPVNDLPVEQTGLRFLTLDSRYTDHKAHLFSVYFRFGK